MKIKLNLIPPDKAAEIQESKKLRIILEWGMEIYSLLVIFFILLASLGYVLKTNLNLVSRAHGTSEINSKYAQLDQYDAKIKEVNALISNVQTIEKNQIYWSKLFSKLDVILTPEIMLSNFSNKDWTIFLIGKAKTREALVVLREKLEKESCFTGVKFPLSNLVSRENVDFQVEFDVKEECVKESQ